METLQIVLVCCVFLFFIVVTYRVLNNRIIRSKSPSDCKMMVAIRRRGTALDHYLKLGGDEKIELVHSLEKMCHILQERWLARSQYSCGFKSDVQGLPSQGDYDWMVFAFYDIADYEHFQRCVAMLEEPQFSNLRHYLDIRLIFGKSITGQSDKITKLF